MHQNFRNGHTRLQRFHRSPLLQWPMTLILLDWAALKPWDTFLPVIARVTGRMLVGRELCKDPDWIQITIANTTGIMKSAMEIRAKYQARWQWLAPWTYSGRNDLVLLRKRATKLIEPAYLDRLGRADKEKERDAIQWLIDNAQGKSMSPAEVTDALLFLYMAGIHSTSATIVSIVYDLIANPEYIPELVEEIHQVMAATPEWSKQSLASLRKLDSFMKESQRLHPAGLGKCRRSFQSQY